MTSYGSVNEKTIRNKIDEIGQLYYRKIITTLGMIDIEQKTGTKGSLYDKQIALIESQHNDLEECLSTIRENRKLSESILCKILSPSQYHILIMGDLLIHSKEQNEITREHTFNVIYERAVIIQIDETLETVEDEKIRQQLIMDKWSGLLSIPELEKWYLGKGFLDDLYQEKPESRMDSLESYYTNDIEQEKLAKKRLEVELARFDAPVIEQETSDIDKKTSAIRLAALLPFLEQDDKEMVFKKIKETLKTISPKVLKKTKARVNKSN